MSTTQLWSSLVKTHHMWLGICQAQSWTEVDLRICICTVQQTFSDRLKCICLYKLASHVCSTLTGTKIHYTKWYDT